MTEMQKSSLVNSFDNIRVIVQYLSHIRQSVVFFFLKDQKNLLLSFF